MIAASVAFMVMVPIPGTPGKASPEHHCGDDRDADDDHDHGRNSRLTAVASKPLPPPHRSTD